MRMGTENRIKGNMQIQEKIKNLAQNLAIRKKIKYNLVLYKKAFIVSG